MVSGGSVSRDSSRSVPTAVSCPGVSWLLSEASDDTAVHLPSTHLQPIASADVVDAIVKVATGTPLQGIWNLAGPDVFSLDELGRVTLAAHHDKRTVITDEKAGVFAGVAGDALTAGPGSTWRPRIIETGFRPPTECCRAGYCWMVRFAE